jgi:DNA replicative helicase MCM subunit Mcm2 (Cdc46/Mcm family)
MYIAKFQTRMRLTLAAQPAIGDGKCLIHSVLYLVDNLYRSSDSTEKMRMAYSEIPGIQNLLNVVDWFNTTFNHEFLIYLRHKVNTSRSHEPETTETMIDDIMSQIPLNIDSTCDNKLDVYLTEVSTKFKLIFPQILEVALHEYLSKYIESKFRKYIDEMPNCTDMGPLEINALSVIKKIHIIVLDKSEPRRNVIYKSTNSHNCDHCIFIQYSNGHFEPLEFILEDGDNVVYKLPHIVPITDISKIMDHLEIKL